jgi:hypothetical protein
MSSVQLFEAIRREHREGASIRGLADSHGCIAARCVRRLRMRCHLHVRPHNVTPRCWVRGKTRSVPGSRPIWLCRGSSVTRHTVCGNASCLSMVPGPESYLPSARNRVATDRPSRS